MPAAMTNKARTGNANARGIFEYYQNEIEAGRMSPGDKLPTYAQAAKIHKVAQATITLAYKTLESHGYVESRHGIGVFVCDRQAALLSQITDRLNQLEELGSNPRTHDFGISTTAGSVKRDTTADTWKMTKEAE